MTFSSQLILLDFGNLNEGYDQNWKGTGLNQLNYSPSSPIGQLVISRALKGMDLD